MTKHRSTVIIPDYKARVSGYKLAEISKQARFVVRLAVACYNAGVTYGMKWELNAGRMLATITAEGNIPDAKPLAKEKVTRVAAWKPVIFDAEYRADAIHTNAGMKPAFVIEHSSGLCLMRPAESMELGIKADGAEDGDIRKGWRVNHSSGRGFGLELNLARATAALLMAAELFDGWNTPMEQLQNNRECRIASIEVRAKYDTHFDRERELARVPAVEVEVEAPAAVEIEVPSVEVAAVMVPVEGPMPVPFGRIYGDPNSPAYITPEGQVWMWRKGQRVRFFTANGYQVGPEQSNVAPAVCAAIAAGWIDINLLSRIPAGINTDVLEMPVNDNGPRRVPARIAALNPHTRKVYAQAYRDSTAERNAKDVLSEVRSIRNGSAHPEQPGMRGVYPQTLRPISVQQEANLHRRPWATKENGAMIAAGVMARAGPINRARVP